MSYFTGTKEVVPVKTFPTIALPPEAGALPFVPPYPPRPARLAPLPVCANLEQWFMLYPFRPDC